MSEVTKGYGKGALKLVDSTATLESAKDGSNVVLDGTSATLSAGNGKGSIKVATGTDNGANKIELSPEMALQLPWQKIARMAQPQVYSRWLD